MKIIRIAQGNIELPADRMPRSNTVFVNSVRLTNTRGGHNKEYVIRVYRYDDGMYSVICWSGSIGGTLRPQPKYFGDRIGVATSIAQRWQGIKDVGGYSLANDDGRAPGIRAGERSFQQESTTTTTTLLQTNENVPIPIQRLVQDLSRRNNATLGRWFYRLHRVMGINNEWVWQVDQAYADDHDHIRQTHHFRDYEVALTFASRLAMEFMERGETDQPTTQTPTQSEPSLPTIDQFTHEITGIGYARMGNYAYSISRVQGDNQWRFRAVEYTEDIHSPTRSRTFSSEEATGGIVVVIELVTGWAIERRNEQLGQASTSVSKEDALVEEDIPINIEDIPEKDREILELLGKNYSWYKTSQVGQLYEIRHRLTNNVIFSSTTTSLRACVVEAVRSGISLSGASLSFADLYNADLSHVNLSHADLIHANLIHADLSHANLINANLINADLSNADLFNANLSGANLIHADLYNADLYNTNLYNANLYNTNLYNANLIHADLSGAINVNLAGALHIETIIREEPKQEKKEPEKPKQPEDIPINIEDIPEKDREILELLGKNNSWYKTSRSTQLYKIIDRYNKEVIFSIIATSFKTCVKVAVRQGISLNQSNLSHYDLSNIDFSYFNLSGADFSYSNLSGADFSYSNLSGADFSRANLSRANFLGSNLSMVNLHMANLFEAIIDNNLFKAIDIDLSGAFNMDTVINKSSKLKEKKKDKELLENVPVQEDISINIEDIPEKDREILELLGENNITKKISINLNDDLNDDWYLNLGESIGDELKGYFKFIVCSDNNPIGIYNIWWEGLDQGIRITKHDLSQEEFEKHKEEIMRKAREESFKAYKEAMMSYAKH